MVAPALQAEGRAPRVLVSVAVVAVLGMDAAYLALIYSQGDRPPDIYTPVFVAGYLALMAVALVASFFSVARAPWLRAVLRGGAAGGLIVLGFLAAFSIGLPILLAGLMAAAATVLELVSRWRVATLAGVMVAAVVLVALLLGGLDYTSKAIVCPATGEMGGTTGSILTGSVTYACHDGHLTFGS